MKYISKIKEEGQDSDIIEAVEVKEDTSIETIFGDVLVTKGNFIVTRSDGQMVGMAALDLEELYTEIKAS